MFALQFYRSVCKLFKLRLCRFSFYLLILAHKFYFIDGFPHSHLNKLSPRVYTLFLLPTSVCSFFRILTAVCFLYLKLEAGIEFFISSFAHIIFVG